MVSPRRLPMEHRWGQRAPCGSRVRLPTGAGICGAGRLRDVSMSGAFLETALELPLFGRVTVAVVRGDPGHEIEAIGSVVRKEPGGVGIEWCETLPGSICALLGCTPRCAAAAG
jgi:hypothetical protein